MPAKNGTIEQRTLLCERCKHEFTASCSPDIPHETFRATSLPSDSEIALQLQYLESESFLLDKYDEQIARTKIVLRNLEFYRLSLRKRTQKRRYFISSQRRLPVEVCPQIFMIACYQALDTPYYGRTTSYSPIRIDSNKLRVLPLVLSQTCSLWRSIVFGFPSLWDRMWIDLSWLTSSSLEKLDTFLQRSPGRLLTLRLESDGSFEWADVTTVPNVPSFLVEALTQSEELEIDLRVLRTLRFGEALSFPTLKYLTLIKSDTLLAHSAPHARDQFAAVISAPSLIHLSINQLTPIVAVGLLPSSNLTSIDCWFNAEKLALAKIAVAYPKLTTMKLVVHCFQPYDHEATIPFPLVKFLEVQIVTENPSQFFDCLTLSSLTNATITISTRNYDDEIFIGASLASWVRRSACSLNALELSVPGGYLHSNPDWLSDIFHLSPRMRSIKFCVGTILTDIFDSLFYRLCSLLTITPEGSTALLPALDTITITMPVFAMLENSLSRDMGNQFLSMVESRRIDTFNSLTYAKLHIYQSMLWGDNRYDLDGRQEVNLEELQRRRKALKDAGMTCSIQGVL
ncbi:hypothetical protein V5O48_015674 [Marasmius crinis-equi]|uniref:F-box domain-containing protein n=1 Tax=Marasmius crinis-equi TaxID=585013 RepID=A0ABR3ETY1_9AGAR